MALSTPAVGTKNERTAASTTSTPAYPTVTAGDLLLGFGVSGATVNNVFDETTSTAFTADGQASSIGNTSAPEVYCAHAIATGSESGTQSWHHSNVITSMCIVGMSGQDPTNPFDPNVNGGAPTLIDTGSASANISIPSVTVTTAGSTLLYVVAANSTSVTATAPGGWTELVDRTTASSRGWQIAYLTGVAAGATGTATGTWSGSNRCVGYLYVIQPAAGVTNVNVAAAIALADTVTSTAQVGVASGSAVALTDTVSSTAQVGVVAGAALALTAAITSTVVIGTASGATVPLTDTITSAAQVGKATGSTVPLVDTITSAAQVGVGSGSSVGLVATITSSLSVAGSGLSIASTVPITDTIASTAQVGVGSGAALSETATVTSGAVVGKQTGAALSETAAITSAAQVGKQTGASIAPVFAVTANGVVGVRPGASVGVTFTVTAALDIGGVITPYVELTAPARRGRLPAPERAAPVAPATARTLTAPARDVLVAPAVRPLTAPEVHVSDTLDRIVQKQAAVITRSVDCSNRLTTAYPGQTITISSAVGSATGGAIISSVSGSGTSITFKLAVAAVTPPTDIVVVLTPTLSNGDTDPLSIPVGVVAT